MMSNLKYRADIDGLRAIAVLGVIVFHAFPGALPGGFIGVDIFFVISGYLISGILYKGHIQGNFSPSSFFLEFYARRIRRLFPSLITVLVLCLAYGWVILLPDEYEQLGKHVAAGTLFIQNIVFWQESGYFDTAANLKPLLHLWSLAVEEQFYIFFPPLLLLIWKRKWPLVIILGVLLLASMIGNLVMSYQNGASDFFLTPYRAWEFLGGSLLAWWHYDKGHQQSEEEEAPKYREALSWIGVILLALGMGFIHKGAPYPGWRALLPVAGTLMLMEGGRSAWVNRKILSNPALVWIGLISYPLYLFHWPALSFVHIVKGENLKPGYVIAALGISLIFSVMTYYFIEKKIRNNTSRYNVIFLALIFALIGALGALVWNGTAVSKKMLNAKKINEAIEDRRFMEGFYKIKWEGPLCLGKIGGDGKQTLFFGDSNMQQYAPRIIKLLKSNVGLNRGAIFVTCAGTPPIVGLDGGNYYREYINAFLNAVKNDNRIDRIVIAASWILYFKTATNFRLDGIMLNNSIGESKALENLGREIHDLVFVEHKKVTVILNIPSSEELEPKMQIKRDMFSLGVKPAPELKTSTFVNGKGAINAMIRRVAEANGANVIDPLPALSKNGICIYENTDGPIRCGASHLRPKYVRDNIKYLDYALAP